MHYGLRSYSSSTDCRKSTIYDMGQVRSYDPRLFAKLTSLCRFSASCLPGMVFSRSRMRKSLSWKCWTADIDCFGSLSGVCKGLQVENY